MKCFLVFDISTVKDGKGASKKTELRFLKNNNSRLGEIGIMKNIIKKSFGKLLAIAFFTAIMAFAASAQSNNLFYEQGGGFFGTVTVIPGSHFEITTNGTIIKTFRDSCKVISATGVLCTFGQFKNGQHIYSGQGQFFQDGTVMLRWTNENIAGVWRNIDTGFIIFKPK